MVFNYLLELNRQNELIKRNMIKDIRVYKKQVDKLIYVNILLIWVMFSIDSYRAKQIKTLEDEIDNLKRGD